MGLSIKGLQARAEKRKKWSRNQVRAKERLRLERLASAEERLQQEIREAEDWARRNPLLKLPPCARVIILIPGLPKLSFRVSRLRGRQILVRNQITTARQFGRKLGVLLDQWL